MLTINPVFKKNCIPIVMASDSNYGKYLSVAITSIMVNSSKQYNYDIIVLGNRIDKKTERSLINMTKSYDNVSIRVFEFSKEIKNIKFNIVSYYSEAIYYRVYMPYIMPKYKKALYLDCDLVVEEDIAHLYNTELGTNLVAAVRDIGMIMHYYTTGHNYIPKEYFNKKLSNVNPNNYFNTGVLVMNLHLLRKEFSLEKLINAVNQPDMIYPDQDGLNIICADRTLLLNSRWNTVPETKGNRNVEQIKQVVPKYLVDEYLAARNSPSIIHYALFEKPWKHSMSMDLDLYSKFWKYAAKSYCFSELYKDIAPQISVAERAQILTSSLNQKIKPLKFNNDVHYCVDDYYVTKLSDIPVKLEIFKIDDDNNIEIEGCVALVDSREFKNIKFWFYDGKTKHFCTIFDRNNTRNSQFETLIGFSVKIPIPESDFNLKLWCSIYGVPVTKVRINFGRFFPINKNLKKQYFFFKGHILSFSNSQLFIKKAKKFTRFLFERDYKKELRKSNNKFFKKAALVRTIRSFFMFFKKKPIWLIKDNFINSDNGFAFYKYLINNHKKDIKIFYVVNKTDLNIKKIRELGGRIIYQQSKKYKFVALMADWFISSVTDNKFTDPFFPQNEAYRDIISIKKFLFLQHGVISQDLSREHNKYVYNPTGFLVSGKQEYDSLLNGNYYYSKDEVWLTGLPRFDYLYNDDKKIITIMFTWRKYLDNIVKRFSDVEEKFSQSEYCKYCYSLINSQKLNAVAKKYGYKIGIKLHPLFAKYSNLLISKNNDNVVILNEHAYSEVFAKSSLIVTDYSSAIYDFLYLKKPVIYSQFDRDSFFSGKHAYDKGYLDYEKDGYGEVEYCLDGTINRIIEYIKSGCKMKDVYKKRVENFFEYSDNENCERVYNEIIKRS